jgi:hypothetical protein
MSVTLECLSPAVDTGMSDAYSDLSLFYCTVTKNADRRLIREGRDREEADLGSGARPALPPRP